MLLGFRRLCHIELSKQLRDALARWFAECRVIEVLQLATEAQPKGSAFSVGRRGSCPHGSSILGLLAIPSFSRAI